MLAILKNQVANNNLLRLLCLPLLMAALVYLMIAARTNLPSYLPWIVACAMIMSFALHDRRLPKADKEPTPREDSMFWTLLAVPGSVIVIAILWRVLIRVGVVTSSADSSFPDTYGPKASAFLIFILAFAMFEFFRPSRVDGGEYNRRGYAGIVSIAVISFAWSSWAYGAFAALLEPLLVQ
ncbi:MAG: hypothetical protein AAF441_02695 [Pseudomonadota bacterium]